MKTKFLLTLFILMFQFNYSQKTVKMVTEYGSKNKEINSLMLFQNIRVETLTFESPDLVGKFYEINLKEYKNGKLVTTKKLFDLEVVDYLKIDTTNISFKFFSKMENDQLTVFVESPQMYSDKKTFNLEKRKGVDYLLKDFQGSKGFLSVPLNDEFPILAIITPVIENDGKSSYCDVAQSEIAPEKFGEKFNIPHYFVISMKFK